MGTGLIRGEIAVGAKHTQSQWATQFLAAAELVRRNYIVSFTMGNTTPVADLMVGTEAGQQFWVDVKGQITKSVWLLRPKPERLNLFYVFVYLSPMRDAAAHRAGDHYFVLTQSEANALVRPGTMSSIPYKAAMIHADRWDKLPPSN